MTRETTRLGVAVAITAVISGCELTELTLVDFADVVIAEVYVTLEEFPANNSLRAFLHGSAQGSPPGSVSFDDATINAVRECAEAIAAISDGQISELDLKEIREAISALSSLIMSFHARDTDTPGTDRK